MRFAMIILALFSIGAGPFGDLYQPSYCLDYELREPARPYEPQAGDVIFYTTNDEIFWNVAYTIAGTADPKHCGVVVRMPDGTFATLECGADDGNRCEVCSIYERMRFHHCNRGRVWARRRKYPLTEEQSCKLTEFAISERGKRFALGRMALLVTPLRARGPLRTQCLGKPLGPHSSYYCAEIVLEALVYAGIIDGETTRPRATFPVDFFLDRSTDRYLNQHISMACFLEPPARWTSNDCPCCRAGKGTYRHPLPEALPVHPYFQRSCGQ